MDHDAPDYRQLSCKRARAAKTYTCVFCGQIIPRNTYYYRTVFLYDGKFGYDRSHTSNSECAYREYESYPTQE